jgi:hypothetical protein
MSLIIKTQANGIHQHETKAIAKFVRHLVLKMKCEKTVLGMAMLAIP